MSGQPFGPSIVRVLAVATAAIVAVPAIPAAPAQAQNLLELLFGGLRGERRAPPPPSQYREPPRHLLEDFPRQQRKERQKRAAGPAATYCVRLCDGRFFPLPRNAGGQAMSPAKLCSAMCPAADTKVFNGSQIDQATASDGQSYSEIRNAFLFREELVDGCSCNGKGSTGLASMSIRDDPTLKPGDIVVTRDGPKVFKGDRKPPHKTSRFVPAEDYKGFSKDMRNKLSNMRINEGAYDEPVPEDGDTTSPATVTEGAAKPRARLDLAPVPVTPVAEAFASFSAVR